MHQQRRLAGNALAVNDDPQRLLVLCHFALQPAGQLGRLGAQQQTRPPKEVEVLRGLERLNGAQLVDNGVRQRQDAAGVGI